MTTPPEAPAGNSPRLDRIRRAYTTVALHVFNLLVTLLVLNGAIAVALAAREALARRAPDRPSSPVDFPRDRLAAAYGDMPMPVVEGTLRETWSLLRLEARPWVHFGEVDFVGSYVNVARGVRANVRRDAPAAPASPGPPLRVFVFGGSTTFGYGVPDWETIPAHLERALQKKFPARAVEVKNYGRAYYFSSQELALFLALLRAGERPEVAVFIDGLNDVAMPFFGDATHFSPDEPGHMERIRAMWAESTTPSTTVVPEWVPMARVARWAATRRRPKPALPPRREPAAEAELIVQGYLQNKQTAELTAAAAGIEAHFIWQPVPVYAYDKSRRTLDFGPNDEHQSQVLGLAYDAVAKRATGVVNLAEMLRDYPGPAYVDSVHYSPAVNRMIAERIAAALGAR